MPAGHVVWSVTASPGSAVVEGQSIFDLANCRSRFVSVELPERQVENIGHGDPAQVRLIGSDRWISGTVVQVRGSAAHVDGRLLAAQLPKPSSQQVSVEVLLPADSQSPDASRQCDIGRQAEVRFDRGIGDMFDLIGRAFAGAAREP
jgi:multidrug resistance efflux pump